MKRAIYPLYAPTDESSVRPILDDLQKRGFTVRNGQAKAGKDDALVLFLSEAVSAEGPEADAFFRLNSGRELVIPVNLDGCTPPKDLQNLLMARHALDGRKYGTAELTELIAKAAGGEKKNRLPLILSLLGVAALLIVGGLIVWNRMGRPDLLSVFAQATPTPTPTPTAEPTPEPTPTPTPSPTPAPTVEGIDVDLTKVAEVVYVGDIFKYYKTSDGMGYSRFGGDAERQSYSQVAYNAGDMSTFFSTETGQEIPMAELGDVSYLTYLPNLMHVTFVNVKGELPDLSSLENLKSVTIIHCEIPDIQGLKGTTITRFEYHGDTLKDFSPLSDCGKLNNLILCPWNEQVELGDLNLPKLKKLNLCGKVSDLGGFTASDSLKEVHLQDTYLTDLSFLAGRDLEELFLDNNTRLTSLTGIEGMRYLRNLNIENSYRLRDISALAGCVKLESIHLGGDWNNYLHDVSVLGTLPRLQYIDLYGVSVNDLDFLKDLTIKKNINLGFCINQGADYSGLAAIDTYSYLHVNTHGNYAAAAPYLIGKTIRQLMIYDGGDVDFSTLPNVTSELDLVECRNRDLTGMQTLSSVRMLSIQDCPYFSSFDGLEGLPSIGNTGSDLKVENCPRLTDWSGIEGKRFNRIEIEQVLTLPDFGTLTFNELKLAKLDADVLPDLACLKEIDDSRNYSFRFEDLPQITDLSPLFRLHGFTLAVPPQVGEQAQGLVDDRKFKECEIVYPDGSWDPSKVQVELLSLDELDTLPPSILKHVKRVTIIGDYLINDDTTQVWTDWSQNPPTVVLTDRATDEDFARINTPGTLFTDFSRISVLTGLEDLNFWYQPLSSLDGIQALEELKWLKVEFCPKLTDASAAFTLQTLREINLERCPVSSLQGVQNLYDLEVLQICNTKITSLEGIEGLKHLTMLRVSGTSIRDFSPLAQMDFTYAMENHGGVQLELNVMDGRQLWEGSLDFLANVPGFTRVVMHDIPVRLWLDYLMDKPVQQLSSDNVGMTQEQFDAFIAAHPELEFVSVSWNQKIKDASALLGLENLNLVYLSKDMPEAIASLGEGFRFELRID